jgi:cell division protein FtsW (lipid II flippase)
MHVFGLATAAFLLVALVVVALLAALALRLVLVAVLVAMFVFPCSWQISRTSFVGHRAPTQRVAAKKTLSRALRLSDRACDPTIQQGVEIRPADQ